MRAAKAPVYDPPMSKNTSRTLSRRCRLTGLAANAASVRPVALKTAWSSARAPGPARRRDVIKKDAMRSIAAVACGLCLGRGLIPRGATLGGGCFMTIQMADGRKNSSISSRRSHWPAPGHMYMDKGTASDQRARHQRPLGVGVPGLRGRWNTRCATTAR